MLCSNCRVIEIGFETGQPATCENGHYLCGQCMLLTNDRCMLCEGHIFDADGQTWMRHQEPGEKRNWTPEMIREWTIRSGFPDNISGHSGNRDIGALSDNCDGMSMNLLYSRGQAYEIKSAKQSDDAELSDSQWDQDITWNNIYPKAIDNFSMNVPAENKKTTPPPKRFVKLGCTEDKTKFDRRDTRQELLDNTKEEIREKIMGEILESFKNEQSSKIDPDDYPSIKKLQTIGVSTESTPKLFSEERINPVPLDHPQANMPKRMGIEQSQFYEKPKGFITMNVETNTIPNPQAPEVLKKKQVTSCVDLKLQQVMGRVFETVTENPQLMTDDQNFHKFLRDKFSNMPLAKLKEIISSIYDEKETTSVLKVTKPCTREVMTENLSNMSVMSNCRRAYYNPPKTYHPELIPSPQFQPISFYNLDASTQLTPREVVDAGTLNIPRSPVICPVTTCQRAFFVSDFTKHVAVDHTKVPRERICPRQCKNFFLDPKLIHFGANRCQILLLVRNKIKNLGHEKQFKDFIPILVMTTKISLLELCCSQYRTHSEEVQNSKQNFIMIWLTGLMPPELPIFVSLTVWARSKCVPFCHIVHSGRLYSMRNSQNCEAVWKSGEMMLLSQNQIDILTDRGKNMLELQVAVH